MRHKQTHWKMNLIIAQLEQGPETGGEEGSISLTWATMSTMKKFFVFRLFSKSYSGSHRNRVMSLKLRACSEVLKKINN